MTLSSEPRTAGLSVTAPVLPEARVLHTPDEIVTARRLQATEYVRAGYVPDTAIDSDGVFSVSVDPWVPFSRYLGAFDAHGTLRATCRVITNAAPWRLPTLRLESFDRVLRRDLEELPLGHLGEVSALASASDAGPEYFRSLMSLLYRDGLDRGLEVYVMCVDRFILQSLLRMDREIFRVAGDLAPAPVRPVYPVWVRVADFLTHTCSSAACLCAR